MTRRLDLMMMVAMALPATSQAIGLGEIKVQSALNEPLVAQIEIVGASAEELATLSAAVANRDIFTRYGADRPSFLSSASFRVGHDAAGRPVLLVKSREAFTEPLVSFLVDLRSTSGELVREYTLLLDPATRNIDMEASDGASDGVQTTPDTPVAALPPALRRRNGETLNAQTTSAPPTGRDPVPGSNATTGSFATTGAAGLTASADTTVTFGGADIKTYRVSTHDTLSAIVRRLGAASTTNVRRMMIAIYRANASAFDGNINRLRAGATLEIPAPATVAAISKVEANREFHTQMAAWHASAANLLAQATPAGTAAKSADTASAAAPAAAPTATSGAATALVGAAETVISTASAASTAPENALEERVRSLESALDMTKRLQEAEHAELLALQQRIESRDNADTTVRTEAAAAAPATGAAAAPDGAALTAGPGNRHSRSIIASIAGVALLVGVFVALRKRFKRRAEEAAVIASYEPVGIDSAPLERPAFSVTSVAADPASAAANGRAEQPPSLTVVSGKAPAPAEPEYTVESSEIDIETASLLALPGASPPPTGSETTVILAVQPGDEALTPVDLDQTGYTPIDLDPTETHVQMPSGLNDRAIFTERRTNAADVLRQAIARHPDRHDLKLKLLEMYYGAAANNRQAFLAVAREMALELDSASDEEWAKIMDMGKEIASDDSLFAGDSSATQPQKSIKRFA